MSPDIALGLIFNLIKVTVEMAAPILLASLATGVIIGVLQTATQVNEPSISFVAKVLSVVLVLLVAGPFMAEKLVAYTRANLTGIETVVH